MRSAEIGGSNNASQVDAVLLDLGNVLVPIDVGRVFEHWARVDGVDAAILRSRWAQDDPYRAYERGEIDMGTWFAHLRSRLGLRQPDEEMLAGWNAIFLDLHPEIAGVVEELSRRYPLYLFSNTNPAHQAWFTSRHEPMLAPFKALYTSCDIGLRKPDARAFALVAQRMGVPPGRIAFFDDLAENVEGARLAGLQAFQVAHPEDIRRALP